MRDGYSHGTVLLLRMNKPAKTSVAGIVIIIVLITLSVSILTSSLTRKIRAGVTEGLAEVTGTDVRVGAIRLSPFTGKGSLSDLVIGNPDGFRSEHLLRCANISIDIEPLSLFSDALVINSIAIDAPNLIYEAAPGGNNISRLSRNAGAGRDDTPAALPPAEEPTREVTAQSESKRTVILYSITVSNAQLSLSGAQAGGSGLTLPLPDIELTDIGVQEGGMELRAVAELIMSRLESEIAKLPMVRLK